MPLTFPPSTEIVSRFSPEINRLGRLLSIKNAPDTDALISNFIETFTADLLQYNCVGNVGIAVCIENWQDLETDYSNDSADEDRGSTTNSLLTTKITSDEAVEIHFTSILYNHNICLETR